MAIVSSVARGVPFTRTVIAIARAALHGGGLSHAAEIARQWPETPEVERYLKAAVAAGNTSDATWAGPLSPFRSISNEFIELVRNATIIGRLANLRRVPFKITVPREVASPQGYWVGEGTNVPVAAGAYDQVSIDSKKAGTIIVVSKELIERSLPGSESAVQRSLVHALSTFLDRQFIDPAIAATAVSPASITHGAPAIPSTGSSVAQINDDLRSVVAALDANLLNPYWVASPAIAIALAFKLTTAGLPAFPTVTAAGGTLGGIPLLVSASVPSSMIVLIDASEILLADDGAIEVDASERASIQMRSDPVSGASTLVSLWQSGLVGVRATRQINYQRAREGSVAVLTGVAY